MPDVSASTVPKKEPASPITWGPVAAVVVTIVAYFVSQFMGSLVLFMVGVAKGVGRAQLDTWTSQVGPQFFFTLLIEGLTLAMLWLFLRSRKANFKTLGLTKPQLSDLGYALAGFAVYLPVLVVIMGSIRFWFPHTINIDQQQQIGFQGAHGLALIVVFISLVVLPPLTEEILFRGFLFAGLKKALPVVWAGLATSFIFAIPHLQPGSGVPLLWAAAIDTFVLSLVLVWLRQKTGRLWAPIGLHVLKNGIAFAALFIYKG